MTNRTLIPAFLEEPRTTDSLRPGGMGEFLARWGRACAACALLMIPCAQAAEKNPWANFKPGSYAKMKSTTTVGANKTVTEMTQTLISLDAKTAVVETETKVMGQSMKNRINIPLQAAATPANAPAAKTPVAVNETITVSGKAIACKCYEMESDANGMKTTSRACSSETVPGGAVRIVSKSSGAVKMDSVSELIEFSAK